jgi:hypothetical protein
VDGGKHGAAGLSVSPSSACITSRSTCWTRRGSICSPWRAASRGRRTTRTPCSPPPT